MQTLFDQEQVVTDSAPQLRTGRFLDLDEEKLRGGYYTSSEVADWLCRWAIRRSTNCVLEPSAGDGNFLCAAAKRLTQLGAPKSKISGQVKGIELVAKEASKAASRLADLAGEDSASVEVGDFFGWVQSSGSRKYDAVVGNPPFIRYQTFPEPYRSRAMKLMVSSGLRPNKLTNIWVPFVVGAVEMLKPGGRLALVLPAELLQVTYAAQLRSFLTDRFRRLNIVTCNELFFTSAEQEVVLLLADDALDRGINTNACAVAITEAATLQQIVSEQPTTLLEKGQPKRVIHEAEKWLKFFLDPKEIDLMRELRLNPRIAELGVHASVDVGVVTGKNEFFVLRSDQVQGLGIQEYVTPLVSRSAHLKGTQIASDEWNELSLSGDRVHLLNFSQQRDGKPNDALQRYIREGETQNIHKGYKCSIRNPWWEVPAVWNPDGFLFRQIYDFPRMVLNNAGATSTDTIHRLRCINDQPERVVSNTYTWLTAASAEIQGRSYGGGVLELEPTEAESLLVPRELNGAMPLADADRLIRAGRLEDVLRENAEIVLRGHLGLSRSDCDALAAVWQKMRDRRLARKRKSRVVKSATA